LGDVALLGIRFTFSISLSMIRHTKTIVADLIDV
jgi:hypothetical protein